MKIARSTVESFAPLHHTDNRRFKQVGERWLRKKDGCNLPRKLIAEHTALLVLIRYMSRWCVVNFLRENSTLFNYLNNDSQGHDHLKLSLQWNGTIRSHLLRWRR